MMFSFECPAASAALQVECEDYCSIFIDFLKAMRSEHVKEAVMVLSCCRRSEKGVFCDLPVLLSLNRKPSVPSKLNDAAGALIRWRSASPVLIALLADRYDYKAGNKNSSDEDTVRRAAPSKKVSLLASKASGSGLSPSSAADDVKELLNELRGFTQHFIAVVPAAVLVTEIDFYNNSRALLRIIMSACADHNVSSSQFYGIYQECFSRIGRIEISKGFCEEEPISRRMHDTMTLAAAPFVAAIEGTTSEWAGSGLAPEIDLNDLFSAFSMFLEKVSAVMSAGFTPPKREACPIVWGRTWEGDTQEVTFKAP